jgi:hypothetical protein
MSVAIALPISLIGRNEAPAAPTSNAIVGTELASKQAADGKYITWVEHRIDDQGLAGIPLRGADGLAMGDIDKDGFDDFVTVHQDSNHVRISFGSADPNRWFNITVADEREAFSARDVSLGDLDGDGWLDVIIASEVAHLLYLENPGAQSVRSGSQWQRLMPRMADRKGSWIATDMADINGNGKLDVLATNKGLELAGIGKEDKPSLKNVLKMYFSAPIPVQWIELEGEPLDDESWVEHVAGSWRVPINAKAVDFDQDGDIDIIGGSRGRSYLVWLKNQGAGRFERHDIKVSNWFEMAGAAGFPMVTGVHMTFHDMDSDGRLDIVARTSLTTLGWLKQPASPNGDWKAQVIARYKPDHILGFTLADIDGDGDKDILTGTYSKGTYDVDTLKERPSKPLGRQAWLENPGSMDEEWPMHNMVRRERGMFDDFVATDRDNDGDVDFVGTRGNSGPHDGLFWLEQRRVDKPQPTWTGAYDRESQRYPLDSER